MYIAAFAGATIAKANMWRTAFSLNGSAMDIVKAFVLIILGTWLYSYILSGIWIQNIARRFKKAPAS